MSVQDSAYIADCDECGEPVDQRDAYTCSGCSAVICRICWPHDGSFLCTLCQEEEAAEEEEAAKLEKEIWTDL